jgi:hypothetical protein
MNEFQYRRMLRQLGQRQQAALREVQEHLEREARRQGRGQDGAIRRIPPQPPRDIAA